MLGKAIQPEIHEWIHERQFDTLREILCDLEIADVAEILEDLSAEDQAVVFRILPRDSASDVFEYLPFEDQETLLKNMSAETVAHILNEMAPDDRTRLLEELPGAVTQRLLKALNPAELKVARSLLGYPEESIGRLMTPDYVAARPSWTAQQTIEHIRSSVIEAEVITYIYVVDDRGHFVDDVHIGSLIRAEADKKLSELVTENPASLSVLDDRELAVLAFKKYDRIALPVLDRAGVLLGIVTVDDVLDVEEEEATEDAQMFGGQAVLEDSYFATDTATIIRKRAGWLTFLFVGGFLTSWAMQHFDSLLNQFLALSFFIPVIIASGGNSGSQSASTIIRSLAIREIELGDWWKVLRRELIIGLALGCFLGIIIAARVAFFSSDHRMDFITIMFIAVIIVVTLGSLCGALLPFFFKRIGFDPAVSSGPFIATFLDVSGILIYLTLATWILKATVIE